MKDNKKKVILFFAIIIIAIVIVILAIAFGQKKPIVLEGNTNIVNSLSASTQSEVDTLIKNDLEEKGYSLQNAKVYINPYGNTPMSALIAFKTDKETTVKVTIKGKNNDDIVLNYDSATYHYIPVYGLYQDYTNTVEVELGNKEKKTLSIAIDKIDYKPSATVISSEVSALDGSLYFVTSPLAMSSFAFDAYGEIRWLTTELYYHSITFLDNGHLLIGTSDVNNFGLTTRLVEIDLLGRLYAEYDIEEGYLNDVFVKEDGNFIVASKKESRSIYSDYIIEIDRETGKIVKSWDLYEIFKAIDPTFTNSINDDNYFYNSGIIYYEETDSLLLTYWGGEFVVNLSYSDSSIKWIFSNPENFTSAFSKYLLKTENGFVYPKGMHSATLDGDTLKVFDNGYSTIKGETNTANLVGSYSSANTYKINGNFISLVNSYDEDKQFFSYALGDYEIVSDDDEIILFGRELKGLDYAKGVNIHNYDATVTRMIEKKSGNTVLDIEVNWGTHTVNKVKLDGNYTFDFTLPEAYTTLEPSLKEEITPSILNQIRNATETVNYKFGYSKLMIEHDVLFMSADEAKLILIDDDNDGAVYTLKVKDETTSRKIVTDLPNGKYYVYVLENGVMYKTDSYIEIK